jgi:hypothetical protein
MHGRSSKPITWCGRLLYSDEPGERLQLVIKLRRSEPGTKSGGQAERHS